MHLRVAIVLQRILQHMVTRYCNTLQYVFCCNILFLCNMLFRSASGPFVAMKSLLFGLQHNMPGIILPIIFRGWLSPCKKDYDRYYANEQTK